MVLVHLLRIHLINNLVIWHPIYSSYLVLNRHREVVAVLAQRFIHHLSRLIDPGGREWNDYLAMIDALQALKRPNVEAAEDNA